MVGGIFLGFLLCFEKSDEVANMLYSGEKIYMKNFKVLLIKYVGWCVFLCLCV